MTELMKQRHSVRQYENKSIDGNTRKILNELTEENNKNHGLNIQIFYDEPKCFDSFMAHYGKFDGVQNYIALVGKKADEEKLGYYGMQLVLKAQECGLNTCWVALTHGKSKAKVGKGEKCVCIIALGYGKTQGVEHSSKKLNEVSNYSDGMPDWFKKGVEGALWAPTAMNQQKFFFKYLPNGKVEVECGKGFYTKLDLGIVKYHFDVLSGVETL